MSVRVLKVLSKHIVGRLAFECTLALKKKKSRYKERDEDKMKFGVILCQYSVNVRIFMKKKNSVFLFRLELYSQTVFISWDTIILH